MRLEGTLDAFSLPDIFQLLSFTKKTGALHLRRQASPDAAPAQHGVVHLRGGAVTGARADVECQELARRLVGSGLVDDDALTAAAEQLADDPSAGLARLLVEQAGLAEEPVRTLACEQVADAVFDLLRWSDGEFAFVVDEGDADDLGAELSVEEVVTEGRRRLDSWSVLAGQLPAPGTVLRLSPVPPAEPSTSPAEWSLLSLVDGRRTVAELVALAGRGEYAVGTALAALVSRGLVVGTEAGEDQLLRRHRLLAALEGRPLPEAAQVDAVRAPSSGVAAPTSDAVAARFEQPPVIPARIEPFPPPRQPDREQVPVLARTGVPVPTSGGPASSSAHGSVHGATALQPDSAPVPVPSGLVDRDPNINKSLLLRLIAGVKGL